ncbi:MAG TPA: DUF6265 family protein [Fimbriimonadaceae bacterium]|nr:DUF6265 family protein [Fimbriimonadaceae bacterium]
MMSIFYVLGLCLSVQNTPSVSDLAWMSGSRSCPKWGGIFEEHWMPPSGNTMQGVGKLTVSGKTSFMEFISIEPDPKDGSLTMWILLGSPSDGEKKGVPFKMTALTSEKVVFENPANDFPSKITYFRPKDNLMRCVIAGKQNGKESQEEFDFKRRT